MSVETARTYSDLSPKAYEHPADRAATSALHTIPLLDRVFKLLSELGFEKRARQILLGNAVRLGDDQIPQVWDQHVRVGSVLDLPEPRPHLYVTDTPIANAMTVGTSRPVVILNSPLLTDYTLDEVEAVLAHEAGHVLSEHVYYSTVLATLSMILQGTLSSAPLVGLPIRALYLVLLEWSRAAELSCDRASALVVDDPRMTCQMLMRMASGPVKGMNLDAFVKQATEYHEEDDLFARAGRFRAEINQTHPFAVNRVRQLVDWVGSGDYDRIRSGSYVKRGEEPAPTAELQEAIQHYRRRFVGIIERTSGGISKLSGQVNDWVRKARDWGRGDDTNDGVAQ